MSDLPIVTPKTIKTIIDPTGVGWVFGRAVGYGDAA
jgi:hypothetical protein